MQAKEELLKKVIQETQIDNRRGVSAIILGQRCGYALGHIRHKSSKEPIDLEVLVLRMGRDEGKVLGFTDFVFDHKTGFIGVTTNKDRNGFGHDGIADALQTPGATGSDERREAIVGGRIAFLNGFFISIEWSGHYGDLWNEGIVGHFQSTFFWSTNQPIYHIRWNDNAAADNPANGPGAAAAAPAAERPASNLLMSCGFFALNDAVTRGDLKKNTPLPKEVCDVVASYLPRTCGFFAVNDVTTRVSLKKNTEFNKEVCDVIASYLPKK